MQRINPDPLIKPGGKVALQGPCLPGHRGRHRHTEGEALHDCSGSLMTMKQTKKEELIRHHYLVVG